MPSEVAAAFTRIEAEERRIAKAFWGPELLAQEAGRRIEDFWDELNAATNKLAAAARFEAGAVVLGRWDLVHELPLGIKVRKSSGTGTPLAQEEWRGWLERQGNEGWELARVEFRHNRFSLSETGVPKESIFYFNADLVQGGGAARASIEGNLRVKWGERDPAAGGFTVRRVDASALLLKLREGGPLFQEVLNEEIQPAPGSSVIDPLIVWDLDGNGRMEIILPARNIAFRAADGGGYKRERFAKHEPRFLSSGVMADITGDGAVDFVGQRHEGVFVWEGGEGGVFNQAPRKVWASEEGIPYGITLTCGDIDTDGDLDLFLPQYEEPYQGGVLPVPFYDGNDGHPAWLLLNEGGGQFREVTEERGLRSKRWRRTYSASFADLDQDQDLDLAVVSDFRGIDLYANDGKGWFSDVTANWVENPHAFGMAHCLADFNRDGLIDILMTGMTSATVDRLDALKLRRPEEDDVQVQMRAALTRGNRLYLQRAEGGFEETGLGASLARSGWSWGCASLDFNNDGWEDACIVNGFESNRSVRDYEGEFWLHDRFVAKAENREARRLYFNSRYSRTRGRDQSYGGYDRNRLYLNLEGRRFFEMGHLAGVASQVDCRNLVCTDLDADGRVDIVFTTIRTWPQLRQTVRVYRNIAEIAGNWIGFRFEEEPAVPAAGVEVVLEAGGAKRVKQIVTGDSYRSQHPPAVHFGMGSSHTAESVEIRWPGGRTLKVERLSGNRYYRVSSAGVK